MNTITLDQLRETFLEGHSAFRVSIFMPAYRAGRDTEQNPIRFKNLLRQAQEKLQAKGLSSMKIQELLLKPQRLLQDQAFWRRQSDGLAVFFSQERFEFFRLPVQFAELVVVSDRFHIKPLLPIITSDSTFYVLTTSQNQVRLLEGTRRLMDEVVLEDVPLSLADFLPDGVPEKQLQFHTGTQSQSGRRSAMFHGHEADNETTIRIQQWFRLIDKQINHVLSNCSSPLVLAGVETLISLYKEVNTYPHLMNEGITGNSDRMKPEELHSKAWAIVEPVFTKERKAGYERYQQLAGTGQTTTTVPEAVRAAHHGRIDMLFVALGVQVWGRFNPEEHGVLIHESYEPDDTDLLDLTAIQTLINGGLVYAVPQAEVPDQALLAAIFRY